MTEFYFILWTTFSDSILGAVSSGFINLSLRHSLWSQIYSLFMTVSYQMLKTITLLHDLFIPWVNYLCSLSFFKRNTRPEHSSKLGNFYPRILRLLILHPCSPLLDISFCLPEITSVSPCTLLSRKDRNLFPRTVNDCLQFQVLLFWPCLYYIHYKRDQSLEFKLGP